LLKNPYNERYESKEEIKFKKVRGNAKIIPVVILFFCSTDAPMRSKFSKIS
tara:strand:- start:79 stop:231 length:153 start_codon:yes stop_codon:yes gene_type:complete